MAGIGQPDGEALGDGFLSQGRIDQAAAETTNPEARAALLAATVLALLQWLSESGLLVSHPEAALYPTVPSNEHRGAIGTFVLGDTVPNNAIREFFV